MKNTRTYNLIMLRLSALVCGLSVLVFVVMLFQSNANKNIASATNYNADQVIISVNNQRLSLGLTPLLVNDLLMTSAQNKANHMAENGYFSHIGYGMKWSDFIRQSGYEYAEAGENLANGFDTVDDMTAAWMNSPSHRENIVNTGVYETGVGVSYGKLDGYPTIFVVQVFGRKIVKELATEPTLLASPQANQNATSPTSPDPASKSKQIPIPAPAPAARPKTLGELLELPQTVVGQ